MLAQLDEMCTSTHFETVNAEINIYTLHICIYIETKIYIGIYIFLCRTGSAIGRLENEIFLRCRVNIKIDPLLNRIV